MSQPYVGEIRMFAGNFAPAGWAFCNGALLPISEFETLFNLIGTTYGGDGQSTFALPNLQSRVPVHMGQGSGLTNRTIGETAGVETVTLTTQQIPAHSHVPVASSVAAGQPSPANNVWAANAALSAYADPTVIPDQILNPAAMGSSGGSQPHDNIVPYLCINFIISQFGVFPSQN
jgi:microcystin-dependent protein